MIAMRMIRVMIVMRVMRVMKVMRVMRVMRVISSLVDCNESDCEAHWLIAIRVM